MKPTSRRKGVSITIPLKPVPAARPKVSRWGTYYPKAHTVYKEECTEFLKSLGLEGWGDQKLEVWTTFFFNPPKRSKFDYPASVGDCDNLVKLVWDCCTDAGLWDDDRQIIRSHEEKHFTDGQARTEITIEPIQDEL